MENNKNTRPKVNRPDTTNAIVARKKRNTGATVAIITLSILLAVSVALGITAAFFTATQQAAGTVTLGDPVNISITQGGTSVSAFTFPGTAMPGTVYDQAIAVSAPADTSDAVLRGKITLANVGTASANITATTATGWTEGEDGYYYYDGTLSAGNSIDFVTAITVPTSLTNEDANKTFTATVQIEAIQFANGAAAEVWTTAPATWVTNYGSGTLPA